MHARTVNSQAERIPSRSHLQKNFNEIKLKRKNKIKKCIKVKEVYRVLGAIAAAPAYRVPPWRIDKLN